MGWQEFILIALIAFLAVPYYFLWKMIRDRGASYWWLLLAFTGWLFALIIGYFAIPRRDRSLVADHPDAP